MGHNRLPGQNAGGWPIRECPECRKGFEPKVANQLFCCPAHKNEWNNRATARGRVLTPLAIVARITRNGTRGTPERRDAGKKASSYQATLIQRYRDEDREAGRMEWADYMIHRIDLGYDPL
ncbi:hypothetical protein [Sphingomonas sp. BAUL-RG-20F-R05-02]|uniref:hypothetical protein n=1 Tax=Sphingomonas sp. BAUL-RG-20F-R05-02 TaxID=2914830 RepID=UPI001F588D2D|nr:hypothetical protein [Sphingomonas sp. BAUL-RG-20F-R05-02]